MKTQLRSAVLALLLTSAFHTIYAQEDISSLFKAGLADLNKVAEGYVRPMGKGFSAGLGTNWYNTAAVHKPWGFDLTVGAGGLFVPANDQSFSLAGLQNLRPTAGASTAPSFAGDGDGVKLELLQPQTLKDGSPNPRAGEQITEFTTPEGVSKIIPAANLQFTLGLPKGTEVSLRLVPTVKVKDLSTNLWGFGIKHNIKQWIPGLKKRNFDLAAMIGYTRFKLDYSFPTPITPDDLVSDDAEYIDQTGASFTGQGFEMSANSFMFNLIASKKLAFFTPYAGVGFTKNTFNFNFTGTYPVLGDAVRSGSDVKVQIEAQKDPVSLNYDTFMPSATVGFRLKILWTLALHAQYAIQKYPVASAGFGINIR